jgi:hypothetical protein
MKNAFLLDCGHLFGLYKQDHMICYVGLYEKHCTLGCGHLFRIYEEDHVMC